MADKFFSDQDLSGWHTLSGLFRSLWIDHPHFPLSGKRYQLRDAICRAARLDYCYQLPESDLHANASAPVHLYLPALLVAENYHPPK